MSQSGHRQIDHTADLAWALWAPSEEALLAEGARAVIAELTEGATVQRRDTRQVELQCLDAGDRLVQWLNEVAALALGAGFLTADAQIELRDGGLSATVWGEADRPDAVLHEVKSVTYHDLQIERGQDGTWQAQVVVDV